ncbi:MAG: ABC transporter permease [Gemmatimonas sp.]
MRNLDTLASACARVYRTLLRCYPPAFRDVYGLDMEEAFSDQLRAARTEGTPAVIALLLSAIVDVVVNGCRERFAQQPKGSNMFHWMDVRYAMRLLRRSPMFTLLTVLVLSGGLGLSIFTFSFLHTAILKPIPVSSGDRVVSIRQKLGSRTTPFDAADIAAMRKGARSVAEIGVYTSQNFVLGDEKQPRVIDATMAEWNVFAFTRARPLLGRTFNREDAERGAEPVIVLNERLWRAAFGSDSAIVGKSIALNGTYTRVIGVMPLAYGFPVASEAWVPLSNDVITAPTFGQTSVMAYARLAEGVDATQAHAELRQLYMRAREQDRLNADAALARTIAADNATADVAVKTFPMAQMGDDGPMILIILNTLAALILLLACINVTNLLLARSNERVRETAVRLALGASRSRLVMQSMWESIILSVGGGLIATACAAWGLDAINRWAQANMQGNLAFWWVWGLDKSAVIAAGLFITATIAVLGLVVSGRATSIQFVAVLKDGSARSGSRREGKVARALVITQVATVSVLMFFGVLASVVAYRVLHVSAGFNTQHLLSTSLDLEGDNYAKAEARRAFYSNTLRTLTEQPAVNGVLLRSKLGEIDQASGAFEIQSAGSTENSGNRSFIQAIEGDAATVGITVRTGRLFDARDVSSASPVAVVSQSFANKYFPGASPIGKQVRFDVIDPDADPSVPVATEKPWRTIVGVSSDVVLGDPLSPVRSAVAIFVPQQQVNPARVAILFRHRGDVNAAHAALYQAMRTHDPSMLPPSVSSYDEILEKSSLLTVSTAKLFAGCFVFALLLAVSGTYGLMARNIGQRTREIGVRRALGASDASVTRLLLGQGGRQLGIGVLVSLPLMLLVGILFSKVFPIGVATTALSAMLVGVSIIGVVLFATWVPTRRAVSIELRDALWNE